MTMTTTSSSNKQSRDIFSICERGVTRVGVSEKNARWKEDRPQRAYLPEGRKRGLEE